MKVTLRHVYIIFVLAVLAAFTIKTQAAERDTGSVFNRLADGLNADGTARNSTNCIICGTTYVCGDLGLELDNGKSLKAVCKEANRNLITALRACPTQNSRQLQERINGGMEVQNYKRIKAFTDPDYIVGIGEGSNSGLNVVSVPSLSHFRKLQADSYSEEALAQRTGPNKIDEAEFSLLSQSLDKQEYREQAIECIQDVNKKIDKDYQKEEKKFYNEAKKEAKKEIDTPAYSQIIRQATGLDESYNSTQISSLKQNCGITAANSKSSGGINNQLTGHEKKDSTISE